MNERLKRSDAMRAAAGFRSERVRLAAAFAGGCLLLLTVLYRFPPTHFTFYPVCPIHQYTRLLCPGCGATRALAALVRGGWREAMRENGMVVVLTPGAILYVGAAYMQAWLGRVRVWPRMPPAVLATTIFCACAFTVLRNLQ